MRLACCAGMMAILFTGVGCSRTSSTGRHSASTQVSAADTMTYYGCPACHVIPHVPGAVGRIGPSLDGLERRSYLGGTLENTPENLVRWIRHPQQIHPGTAMPEMGVNQTDAGRIAAFLEPDQ